MDLNDDQDEAERAQNFWKTRLRFSGTYTRCQRRR